MRDMKTPTIDKIYALPSSGVDEGEAVCTNRICLLTADDLQRELKTSRSQIYINMKTRGMPAPIRFGARCVRWRAADIEAWLDTLAEATPKARPASDHSSIDASSIGQREAQDE